MTPISAIAMVGIGPRREAGAASGLSNMLRNLGGAVGNLAAVETFFTKREQFLPPPSSMKHVSLVEPATRNRLADLQQYFMSHGFPTIRGGHASRPIIAVGQTRSGPRPRSWVTPTPSDCSAPSSSSRSFQSRCSKGRRFQRAKVRD